MPVNRHLALAATVVTVLTAGLLTVIAPSGAARTSSVSGALANPTTGRAPALL
jgi:hypothetical protein